MIDIVYFGMVILLAVVLVIIIIRNRKLSIYLDVLSKDMEKSIKIKDAFFENSCIPIIIIDHEKLTFIDCNQSAMQLYKFNSKAEMKGLSVLDMSPKFQYDGDLSLDKAQHFVEIAREKGFATFEWQHQYQDGVLWDAEIHLFKFIINNKEYLQFSVTDITEQVKHKRILDEIIETNPTSIQIVNKEGITIKSNTAFFNLFGMNPISDIDIFNDERLLKHDFKSLLDQVKSGEVVHFPSFCYNPSDVNPQFENKEIWIKMTAFSIFDMNAEPYTYIFMYENVTDQKLAEDALRKSESLARTVIDCSALGISVRSNTGQLLLYNQAWINLWEITPERLAKDLLPRESLHFNERDEYFTVYQKNVYKIYTQGGEYYIPEILTTGKFSASGRQRYISQHFKSIHNQEGNVERVVILSNDITESKVAEHDRERLQVQLIQAQKMESVGRLAGGVAHDFNNMLGVIIGYADMAMIGLDRSYPIYNYLHEISKAANSSANLTRQLLAFARKQTVRPIVLDLNKAVGGMKKMLSRLIRENIELIFLPSKYNIFVEIDPSQIDQILANLCVNARDAITDSGRITIETSSLTINEDYCLHNPDFTPGDYALLVINDNGYGMSKETLSHIFEPFFTTKDIGKGTGLGLATVYGIIKQNNGSIEVYSELGVGTSFRIYIPKYSKNTDNIQVEESEIDLIRGHETILIVEDEQLLLDMTRTMLEMYGYRVLSSTSASEALNIARDYQEKIHLLLTDVVMPEMNGKELSENILTIDPNIKCLFMSGYTDNIIEQQSLLQKGIHFLQKPFNIEDLAKLVRKILEEA